jgi:hypothetical protein
MSKTPFPVLNIFVGISHLQFNDVQCENDVALTNIYFLRLLSNALPPFLLKVFRHKYKN